MNDYKYPFYTALSHADEMYGVDMSPDEFESTAIIAWERIGNKQYSLFKMSATPKLIGDCVWSIELPCNVDVIEAVTRDNEDWEYTSNQSRRNYKGYTESFIEEAKVQTNSLYASGGYVPYRKEDNVLLFDTKYNNINILYKGFITDEEGLPKLTIKEVDAIAAFCAYVSDFKAARIARDKATMEMALLMKQTWEKLCTQARIPTYINQNEMNEILDVQASWDRKRFGKSFKPIR